MDLTLLALAGIPKESPHGGTDRLPRTYYTPPNERNSPTVVRTYPWLIHRQHQDLLPAHAAPDPARRNLQGRAPEDRQAGTSTCETSTPQHSTRCGNAFSALWLCREAGKMGVLLFQFPQWFPIGKRNKGYILECAHRAPRRTGSASSSETKRGSARKTARRRSSFSPRTLFPTCVSTCPRAIRTRFLRCWRRPRIWRSCGFTSTVPGGPATTCMNGSGTGIPKASSPSGRGRSARCPSRPGHMRLQQLLPRLRAGQRPAVRGHADPTVRRGSHRLPTGPWRAP